MRHTDCVLSQNRAQARTSRNSYSIASLASCLFVSTAIACSSVVADAGFGLLPSLSAEHITLSSDGEEVLARSVVQLSPNGMKVFDFGEGHSAEIIQNFDDDRVWLINRARNIVYELPQPEEEETISSQPQVNESASHNTQSNKNAGYEKRLGLLSIEPCMGLTAVSVGNKIWRGQSVEVWDCLHDGNKVSNQYFSSDWRIVVREKRIGGAIEELRSLKRVSFPTKHFNPEKKFRLADLRELLLGSKEIGKFSE